MRKLLATVMLVIAGQAGAQDPWSREGEISTDLNSYAEFAFTRIIFKSGYQPLPGPGNTAWRDWPDSDMHFIRGIRRLTAVSIEDQSRAIRLTDEQLFDRPWIYALEVGTWLLSDAEADSLREYLLRGGFLVVDDFHGTMQWSGFMRSMKKVFPNRPIVDLSQEDAIMNIHFNVDNSQPIPGIMALRYGVTYEHDGYTPTWKGIYDDNGRLMVIINFNVDLGDAWEMADESWYPEKYTATAYRYGVNFVLYAMTH
ncbi:MAG: DUF4159 domain-containing protein [Gammaproteobacteria bacterium]|nr:DUF4159 domain-containing protein [Gammaproteobacteria bacterium]